MSSQDVLSSTLSALRITGSLILDGTHGLPWAVHVPGSPGLSSLLKVDSEARVVAFHAAERGAFALIARDVRVTVGSGELAAVFSGVPHSIEPPGWSEAIPLEAILSGEARPSASPAGDATKIFSGVFILHDTVLNPVIASLPPVLHTRLTEGLLEPVTQILREELHTSGNASAFLIDRALELLCATLIRQHSINTPDDAVGFFRGLKDLRLCRALAEVHRNPRYPWSVEDLAKQAGLSRSRFSARFHELIGEGPMAYVTRWRMSIAARRLRRGGQSVAEVAASVGYDSVPAFTRVFKRNLGAPPSRFRGREANLPSIPAEPISTARVDRGSAPNAPSR